jgi:hypothetical protein
LVQINVFEYFQSAVYYIFALVPMSQWHALPISWSLLSSCCPWSTGKSELGSVQTTTISISTPGLEGPTTNSVQMSHGEDITQLLALLKYSVDKNFIPSTMLKPLVLYPKDSSANQDYAEIPCTLEALNVSPHACVPCTPLQHKGRFLYVAHSFKSLKQTSHIAHKCCLTSEGHRITTASFVSGDEAHTGFISMLLTINSPTPTQDGKQISSLHLTLIYWQWLLTELGRLGLRRKGFWDRLVMLSVEYNKETETEMFVGSDWTLVKHFAVKPCSHHPICYIQLNWDFSYTKCHLGSYKAWLAHGLQH